MPCGALSSMWDVCGLVRFMEKSGAAAMLAFGLGTCVFMLAFGLFGVFIPKKYNKYLCEMQHSPDRHLGLDSYDKGY